MVLPDQSFGRLPGQVLGESSKFIALFLINFTFSRVPHFWSALADFIRLIFFQSPTGTAWHHLCFFFQSGQLSKNGHRIDDILLSTKKCCGKKRKREKKMFKQILYYYFFAGVDHLNTVCEPVALLPPADVRSSFAISAISFDLTISFHSIFFLLE